MVGWGVCNCPSNLKRACDSKSVRITSLGDTEGPDTRLERRRLLNSLSLRLWDGTVIPSRQGLTVIDGKRQLKPALSQKVLLVDV